MTNREKNEEDVYYISTWIRYLGEYYPWIHPRE